MSSPDELHQKALDDAEGMTPEARELVVDCFWLREPVMGLSGRPGMGWAVRSGKAWGLALNALGASRRHEMEARRRALTTGPLPSEERQQRLKAESDAVEAARPSTNVEDMQAYNAVMVRRQKQGATMFEMLREWREAQAERLLEYDRRLFAEAKVSMSRMADELEGETCECELCVRVDSGVV